MGGMTSFDFSMLNSTNLARPCILCSSGDTHLANMTGEKVFKIMLNKNFLLLYEANTENFEAGGGKWLDI